jgi:hypothetical protein
MESCPLYRIRLGGLQYQELKLLIDFMYKAELEVTVDSAPAIMAAADLLLMEKAGLWIQGFWFWIRNKFKNRDPDLDSRAVM